MASNSWTPSKERLLRQLYAAYEPPEVPPVAKFADLLGVTTRGVTSKARALGLYESWSEADHDRLLQLCGKMSIPEIAAELDKNRQVVAEKLRGWGVEVDHSNALPFECPACEGFSYRSSQPGRPNKFCSVECASSAHVIIGPSEDELRQMYEVELLSSVDIAKKFDVRSTLVLTWMDTFGIRRRTAAEAQLALHRPEGKGQEMADKRLTTMLVNHGSRVAPRAGYTNTHGGKREDLGVSVRSSWEANVLRYLNLEGREWTYEPKTFDYPIKRGTRSYTPDIFLPGTNEWIEVKGYFRPVDWTKLKRFRKYYPDEFSRLSAIVKNDRVDAYRRFSELEIPIWAFYDDLSRDAKPLIEGWEGR